MQLNVKDPSKVVIPVQQKIFEWSFENSIPIQIALHNYTGQVTYHLSSHKSLQLRKTTMLSL